MPVEMEEVAEPVQVTHDQERHRSFLDPKFLPGPGCCLRPLQPLDPEAVARRVQHVEQPPEIHRQMLADNLQRVAANFFAQSGLGGGHRQ
eukprot:7470941-Lingulodinium_polyedra.AAC.1